MDSERRIVKKTTTTTTTSEKKSANSGNGGKVVVKKATETDNESSSSNGSTRSHKERMNAESSEPLVKTLVIGRCLLHIEGVRKISIESDDKTTTVDTEKGRLVIDMPGNYIISPATKFAARLMTSDEERSFKAELDAKDLAKLK